MVDAPRVVASPMVANMLPLWMDGAPKSRAWGARWCSKLTQPSKPRRAKMAFVSCPMVKCIISAPGSNAAGPAASLVVQTSLYTP